MDNIVAIYYIGLLFFGLNGIMWMALRREAQKVAVAQEINRQLLLRIRRR